MTFTYARVGVELWGSKSIGESTQRQLDNVKSKRRVCIFFCGQTLKIIDKLTVRLRSQFHTLEDYRPGNPETTCQLINEIN